MQFQALQIDRQRGTSGDRELFGGVVGYHGLPFNASEIEAKEVGVPTYPMMFFSNIKLSADVGVAHATYNFKVQYSQIEIGPFMKGQVFNMRLVLQ